MSEAISVVVDVSVGAAVSDTRLPEQLARSPTVSTGRSVIVALRISIVLLDVESAVEFFSRRNKLKEVRRVLSQELVRTSPVDYGGQSAKVFSTMHRMFSSIARCVVPCLLVLAVFSTEARAQDLRVGLKGGLSLSTFQGDTQVLVDNVDFSSLRRRASYQVGGFASIRLSERFHLRPELYYIQKGAVLEGENLGVSEVTGTYRFAYIQAPLLLGVRIPTDGTVTPSFYLGPSVSFSTVSGVEVTVPDETRTRNFDSVTETLDIGGIAGASLRYQFSGAKSLIFDVRYNPGFSDILSEDNVSMRTDSINLSLGYAFSL